MNTFKVSFIGHLGIEDYREVENRLTAILSELLQNKEYLEFQIGRNGEFDIFAASCIKQLQKRYGEHNSSLTLVLPTRWQIWNIMKNTMMISSSPKKQERYIRNLQSLKEIGGLQNIPTYQSPMFVVNRAVPPLA